MSKSLLESEKGRCFICYRYGPTEKHHIFGSYNRKKSEEDGLFVYLCHSCHNEPPNGVHFNKHRMEWLHKYGQTIYEARQTELTSDEARQKFMERYGKNYL